MWHIGVILLKFALVYHTAQPFMPSNMLRFQADIKYQNVWCNCIIWTVSHHSLVLFSWSYCFFSLSRVCTFVFCEACHCKVNCRSAIHALSECGSVLIYRVDLQYGWETKWNACNNENLLQPKEKEKRWTTYNFFKLSGYFF